MLINLQNLETSVTSVKRIYNKFNLSFLRKFMRYFDLPFIDEVNNRKFFAHCVEL